jgi:hypothetical protein
MKPEDAVTVTFRPQAWINDYAVDVDPEGPTEFDVPASTIMGIKPGSHESDALRDHENCPRWAREWRGPFVCEWEIHSKKMKGEPNGVASRA